MRITFPRPYADTRATGVLFLLSLAQATQLPIAEHEAWKSWHKRDLP